MSGDITDTLNKINTSVNEKDRTLWEYQAAAKCNAEAAQKIKEECDRLKKEIQKTDDEISEIEPQINILETNYEVQIESLNLNQQALINQKIYKKCLEEKVQKYKEETNRLIEEYAQYIQDCKQKLESTNPTYKMIQAKKIELKRSKIRCMDLKQKIVELKKINNQKAEIKRQLFYNDVIDFANDWINNKKYLEATERLKEETKKEKECMMKLAEVTELVKQKQDGRFLRNKTANFNIPRIEFSTIDVGKSSNETVAEKATLQLKNPFAHIKTMLNDANVADNSKLKEPQKLNFNNNNTKVRILENTTIKRAQSSEKLHSFKTKEERSKEIELKIQKVVQKFNKNISRQNSKRSIISSSQKNYKVDIESKLKENIAAVRNSQQKNLREENIVDTSAKESCGATQGIQKISLTGPDPENFLFPSKQQSYFTGNEISKTGAAQKQTIEGFGGNAFSQNANFLSGSLSGHLKTASASENAPFNLNKNSQFCSDLDNQMKNDNSAGKFVLPSLGFKQGFGAMSKTNQTFLTPSDNIKNSTASANVSLQLDADDRDDTLRSPVFSPSGSMSPNEENNAKMNTNLFSFGSFNPSFNFKLN